MKISKLKIVNGFIFFFIIGSLLVDLYNGYTQKISGDETSLQYLYKGAVFIIAAPAILKNNKYSGLLLFILFLISLSFIYCIGNNYIVSPKTDIVFYSKVLYGYFILLFFIINKKYIKFDILINYIILYGVIAAISIFVTYFLGISLYKYGEDYSFGIQGLFIAGNDLGLTFLICNSMNFYKFAKTENPIYIISNIIISLASIVLGSVAGIFGTVSLIVLFAFTSIFFFRKRNKIGPWLKFYLIALVIIVTPVLITAVSFIINIDSYNREKFSIDRLASGGARNILKESGVKVIDSYNWTDLLFGKGSSNFLDAVGKEMHIGSARAIELDQYELIGTCGIILGSILLIIPIILFLAYIRRFLQTKSLFYLWGCIALGLFISHGWVAGHAYLNVMSLQFVAILAFGFISNFENEKNIIRDENK